MSVKTMSEETKTDNSGDEYDEDLQVQYKEAIKKYLLQCLLMEGSKIILFFIIFACFDLLFQYMSALLVLMLVRCNGGGLHCRHYTTCLLLSLIVLCSCIFCGIYIPLDKFIAVPVLLICCILGYICVPIVSANRPSPGEKLIEQSKIRTARIILFYCFLICICPYSQYFNIGTWTIIIHILQLLFAKLIQRGDRRV